MSLVSYFQQKYKHLRRYNHIIAVFVKYGFEDVAAYMQEDKRFKFIRKLIPKKTSEHALSLSKWEKMRLVCEELGPSFVKFGQLLSNRADLLPAALIKELEKLQDSVPPVPASVALTALEQELKKPVEELFARFEPQAFASASMAQVHKATLKSGEKVVVKIQRPGIKEILDSDIKAMLYMADLFSKRIPSLKSLDLVTLVKNFEASLLQELDFIHESINVQRFSQNFTEDESPLKFIYCPRVFKDYCSAKVLTMEFIDGIKISNYDKLLSSGLDRKLIAKRLAHSYFKQIFGHGFFHADPHPGNLLVLPGNVICYLDYGMMGNILKKDVEQLGSLFLSVRSKDVRKIIRALQQLSDINSISNYRALENDLNELVQNYSIKSLHEKEMSTVLIELKDIIVKHKLKAPAQFFLLARSLVSIEGVIRNLDPEIDLMREARPFFIRTLAKHYNPLQFTKRVLNSVYEMGMYMEEFPRDLKNAIRKINQGEIKVNLHHKGIDPLIHTINRISKQLISAVIIAALVIGSALLMVNKTPPLWNGQSGWGIIGFCLAAIIALNLLRDLKKGDHDEWTGWEDE